MAVEERTENQGGREPELNVPWEEFKLVQDKIDKIADFRFRVRGLAAALVTGLLAAGFSEKLAIPWFSYLFGLLPLVAFHLMELRQDAWHSSLTLHAIRLERHIRGRGGTFPSVASVLMRKGREQEDSFLGWLVAREGAVFYCVMYVILVLATGVSLLRMSLTRFDPVLM